MIPLGCKHFGFEGTISNGNRIELIYDGCIHEYISRYSFSSKDIRRKNFGDCNNTNTINITPSDSKSINTGIKFIQAPCRGQVFDVVKHNFFGISYWTVEFKC